MAGVMLSLVFMTLSMVLRSGIGMCIMSRNLVAGMLIRIRLCLTVSLIGAITSHLMRRLAFSHFLMPKKETSWSLQPSCLKPEISCPISITEIQRTQYDTSIYYLCLYSFTQSFVICASTILLLHLINTN